MKKSELKSNLEIPKLNHPASVNINIPWGEEEMKEGRERDAGVRKTKSKDLKLSLEGREAGVSKLKGCCLKLNPWNTKGCCWKIETLKGCWICGTQRVAVAEGLFFSNR